MDKLEQWLAVPSIGVIQPGAVAAKRVSKNGRIGIIGTTATVNSNAYSNAVLKLDSSKSIISNSCPLFVPLVEEGWADTDVAEIVASSYLKPLQDFGVDTIVMGCTHYPLLKGVVNRVLGNNVNLVDPACETASEFKRILIEKDLLSDGDIEPVYSYFVSDDPGKFTKVGTAFLHRKINNIQKIDIEQY
jgi:glutamate racemase